MLVDDNRLLEENILYVGAPVTEGGVYDGQVWGCDGTDPKKAANHHRSGPKLPSVSPSIGTNLTFLDYFLIIFPIDYVKGTMFPVMNSVLPEGDTHVSENYFIKWLTMWLVMGCYEGNWGCRYWWSQEIL